MGQLADIIRGYEYTRMDNEGDADFLDPEFLEMAEAVMGGAPATPEQVRKLACAAYLNGVECIESRLFFRKGINPYKPTK